MTQFRTQIDSNQTALQEKRHSPPSQGGVAAHQENALIALKAQTGRLIMLRSHRWWPRRAPDIRTQRYVSPHSRCIVGLLFTLFIATPVFAQDARSIELPNAMTIHTWFIIGAAGAFLAWCISYAIQLQKESIERNRDRGDLRQTREELLNKLAELESQREAGRITDPRYKHEFRELKFRLAKVLEQIANPEDQKSAKKTS